MNPKTKAKQPCMTTSKLEIHRCIVYCTLYYVVKFLRNLKIRSSQEHA